MKSTLISSFTQISGLQPGNCILSSILASMHLKQRWQYWSISKAVPSGFHEWLHRNRINTICKFLRIYWTNMRLKVTISWITSLPVMKHSITSTGGNPWSGNMWIPWGRRSWICSPQYVKDAQFFWDRKGMIILHFLKSRQAITSDNFIITLTKTKPWTSRARPTKKITFLLQHYNTKTFDSLKTL